MSQVLNDEDLVQITGYSRKSKQIEQLNELGIRFFKRADGKPVVPLCAVHAALGLSDQEPSYQEDDGFNLE